MTDAACAGLVERGDPDRFMAAMAASLGARARLMPLLAFNLEVARAPWVTKEPMIAEMRLQWWRDAIAEIIAGGVVRAHEVVAPLAFVIREAGLSGDLFERMITARQWDIYPDPFEDAEALHGYLDATAGGLMWLSARALGAPEAAEPVVRDYAFGSGVAGWLRAVPVLEDRGRRPLVDGRPDAVADLARLGLDRIARARTARALLPATCRPALLPGWQAEALLRQAMQAPRRVADGTLAQSEFARRGGLMLQAMTGRW